MHYNPNSITRSDKLTTMNKSITLISCCVVVISTASVLAAGKVKSEGNNSQEKPEVTRAAKQAPSFMFMLQARKGEIAKNARRGRTTWC